MHYILNEANHIIAADTELLSFCGVTGIDELYLKIGTQKINFIPAPQDHLSVDVNGVSTLFPSHQISLSSMLGHLTLIVLEAKDTEQQEIISTVTPITTPIEIVEEIEEIIKDVEDPMDSLNLFDTPATTTVTPTSTQKEIPASSVDSVTLDMDNLLDEIPSNKKEESAEDTPIETAQEEVIEEEIKEIFIDLNEVSQKIGVSNEDYIAFFDEYIETAESLKNDLMQDNESKRSTAIATLSHLGYMLYLPEVGDILTHMKESSAEKIQTEITHFYAIISHIKFDKTQPNTEEPKKESVIEEKKKTPSINGFGTINLEGVQPIHFDFQLEQAASELSLPVELIEEFVNDFIDQAHTETIKILDAYEKGDLDTIQKIGHLLKGASSNLRIVPLSDTLYQIQFCEDPNLLEGYILDYWGHFLAFETQIKMISH